MNKRLVSGGLSLIAAVLIGCSNSDQERARREAEKAKERARQEAARTRQEAQKLGNELKQDAQRFNNQVEETLKGGSREGARQKLENAGETAKSETKHTAATLDRATLIAKVKAKLVNDVGFSTASTVHVDADGPVVTLKGSVPSEDQKRRVEQVASNVEGVTKVINDLRVQP